MEIVIAIFIGLFLVAASLISYFWLKWDYKHIDDNVSTTRIDTGRLEEIISDVTAECNTPVDLKVVEGE